MAEYEIQVPEGMVLKLWTPDCDEPKKMEEYSLKGGKSHIMIDGQSPNGSAHWLILPKARPVVGAMQSFIENQGFTIVNRTTGKVIFSPKPTDPEE